MKYLIEEDLDVTGILGVTKYEPVIPACLRGHMKGNFPIHTSKTKETRVQANPKLLKEFMGKRVYVTLKVDGTSSTFSNFEGEQDICGRNISFKETEGNTYWSIYHKYNFKQIFEQENNISIQGEIAGPGIQKNPLELKERELFVFTLFDIAKAERLGLEEMGAFCLKHNLQMAPVLERDLIFDFTQEELLEMAKGKYEGTKINREGIVIRPMVPVRSEVLNSSLSMKVINNVFLLKNEA